MVTMPKNKLLDKLLDNTHRVVESMKLDILQSCLRILKTPKDAAECDTWRGLVVARLQALKPDLVIEASIRDLVTSNATDSDPVHQGAAMARKSSGPVTGFKARQRRPRPEIIR